MANPAEMNLLTYYRKRETPVGTYFERKMRRRMNSDHKVVTVEEIAGRQELQKSTPSVVSESCRSEKSEVGGGEMEKLLSGIKECEYEGSSQPRVLVQGRVSKTLFQEEFGSRINEKNSESDAKSMVSDFASGIVLKRKDIGFQNQNPISSCEVSLPRSSIPGNFQTENHEYSQKRLSRTNSSVQSQIETKEEFYNQNGELLHTTHVVTKTTSVFGKKDPTSQKLAEEYKSVEINMQKVEKPESVAGKSMVDGLTYTERKVIEQIPVPMVSCSNDLQKVELSTYSKSGTKQGMPIGPANLQKKSSFKRPPSEIVTETNPMSIRYSNQNEFKSESQRGEDLDSSASSVQELSEVKNNLVGAYAGADIGGKSLERLENYESSQQLRKSEGNAKEEKSTHTFGVELKKGSDIVESRRETISQHEQSLRSGHQSLHYDHSQAEEMMVKSTSNAGLTGRDYEDTARDAVKDDTPYHTAYKEEDEAKFKMYLLEKEAQGELAMSKEQLFNQRESLEMKQEIQQNDEAKFRTNNETRFGTNNQTQPEFFNQAKNEATIFAHTVKNEEVAVPQPEEKIQVEAEPKSISKSCMGPQREQAEVQYKSQLRQNDLEDAKSVFNVEARPGFYGESQNGNHQRTVTYQQTMPNGQVVKRVVTNHVVSNGPNLDHQMAMELAKVAQGTGITFQEVCLQSGFTPAQISHLSSQTRKIESEMKEIEQNQQALEDNYTSYNPPQSKSHHSTTEHHSTISKHKSEIPSPHTQQSTNQSQAEAPKEQNPTETSPRKSRIEFTEEERNLLEAKLNGSLNRSRKSSKRSHVPQSESEAEGLAEEDDLKSRGQRSGSRVSEMKSSEMLTEKSVTIAEKSSVKNGGGFFGEKKKNMFNESRSSIGEPKGLFNPFGEESKPQDPFAKKIAASTEFSGNHFGQTEVNRASGGFFVNKTQTTEGGNFGTTITQTQTRTKTGGYFGNQNATNNTQGQSTNQEPGADMFGSNQQPTQQQTSSFFGNKQPSQPPAPSQHEQSYMDTPRGDHSQQLLSQQPIPQSELEVQRRMDQVYVQVSMDMNDPNINKLQEVRTYYQHIQQTPSQASEGEEETTERRQAINKQRIFSERDKDIAHEDDPCSRQRSHLSHPTFPNQYNNHGQWINTAEDGYVTNRTAGERVHSTLTQPINVEPQD